MSSTVAPITDDLPLTSSPGTPPPAPDLPTTSFVVKNAPQHLKPKEAVACMNCPMAVWMASDKSIEAYCRVLYKTVWETGKPGKIRMCDAPEQARQAAEEKQRGFLPLNFADIPEEQEMAPKAVPIFHPGSVGVDAPLMPGDKWKRDQETGQLYVLRETGEVQWQEVVPVTRSEPNTAPASTYDEDDPFGLSKLPAPSKKAPGTGFL